MEDIEIFAALGFLLLLLLGLILLVYGTIVKNKFGINFHRVLCPNCGTEMPKVRAPRSVTETLWGGFTCPKCGCRMDKWGRRLPT
jgi:prepilin signal peptidase PulO-like enzyme (type II secretory pathway)